MLKPTAALLTCFVAFAPLYADETAEPAVLLLEPGAHVSEPLICHTLEDADLLSAQTQETEDLIERLREEILDLKAVIAHAQAESDLFDTKLQREVVLRELAEARTPGFWRRNFGPPLWAGLVAGYAANELVTGGSCP